MRLESRWVGPAPADAPTIVMLGEGSPTVPPWGGFADSLARATGCGVSVCSRVHSAGSDSTARPRPATPDTLEAISRVLETIGFARGILIGYGEGASIATIYVGGLEDHRVRGLVLIAPRFFVEGEWDIRESIGYIRVPILIVRGTSDADCTMAQIDAAQDEAYCPVDVGLIEGAGRAPHLERPEETRSVISGFVSTLFMTFGEDLRSNTIRSEQPDHGPRA